MIRLALLPESTFLLSVLLTYLVHSTLWFLVAWAASHPGLGLSSAVRSRVWRAALVGPLLGTVLALSVADVWRVPAVELTLAPTASETAPAVVAVPSASGRPALIDLDPEAPWAGFARSPTPARPAASPPAHVPDAPAPVAINLGLLVLAAIVATAGGRLAILGARHLRFWRRLRGRRAIHDGAACERLRALAATAELPFPVRLSISPLARGPMALGRGEICLPPRALDDLPGPALSAVLAHEIAHLERQDNAWLTAGAVIEALLFFQPLTRIARRQLSAAAELACDERAVELTASPVDLARSIAIVAAWQLGRHEAVPVAAMARTPIDGDIVDRVKRLLAEPPPELPGSGGRSRLVFGVLIACGLVAPAIGGPGALQAAAVPMPLPKATQHANRFLAPPADMDIDIDIDLDVDWDHDRDEPRPRRRAVRVRVPRMPRMPLAPLPPVPPVPPVPPMPPMPASGARVGELAGKMSELGMRLAELHASRAGETLTDADQAKVKQLERQIEELRKQLEVEEKRFSRDMEGWGKRYEQQFGKDFERKMEEWGRAYGRRMEEWQRRHGREFDRWSREFALKNEGKRWKFAEKMRERQEEARRDEEEARRRRQEEIRKQWERGRKQWELDRQHREEQRRQWEEARRDEEEARRDAEEARREREEARREWEEEHGRQSRKVAPPPGAKPVPVPALKAVPAPGPKPVPVPAAKPVLAPAAKPVPAPPESPKPPR